MEFRFSFGISQFMERMHMCLKGVTVVLFRLVSTKLLEENFYTCANTKGETELAKRALLEEKQEKHLGR
jgi:hypothetical protein